MIYHSKLVSDMHANAIHPTHTCNTLIPAIIYIYAYIYVSRHVTYDYACPFVYPHHPAEIKS